MLGGALVLGLSLWLASGSAMAQDKTPIVSVSDVQQNEDETWMTFEVSLSAASRQQVTVEVYTSDGTATRGTDYRSASRKLTFPPNSTNPQHFPVLVYDDQELEPDETFTVTLTNPTGATLGDATATGTIKNDGDTAAKLTASDIGDTTATLTISGHTDSWVVPGPGLGNLAAGNLHFSHRRQDDSWHQRSHGSEATRVHGVQR